MRWIRGGWRRLRWLTRVDGLERGLDEEIRFHIERQMDKNMRAGMTPDEARRRRTSSSAAWSVSKRAHATSSAWH
jgi:hypothetical protein